MAVMPGQFFGLSDSDRFSPDVDNFWAAYSERDFESVYETAHQEEIGYEGFGIAEIRRSLEMRLQPLHLLKMKATKSSGLQRKDNKNLA